MSSFNQCEYPPKSPYRQKSNAGFVSVVNKIHYQHWMWDLLHKSWYSRPVYLAFLWNALDFYGTHMAAFYCVQLNHFKLRLTFWSGNQLYNVSLELFTVRLLQMSPQRCSRTGVSNMRLSQQHLVKEPFLLLMAWPTSQFRELIKAVWCRSWSCTMSLTDAQLSKIRNAQLVAFTGLINMH